MMGAALALTLAYVATAALLLNLNLSTARPFAVKAGAVVLVTGLYFTAWQAQKGLLGWATPAPVPATFRLHWVTVDEPDKAADGPGAIYLWVRELDDAGLPNGPPRAHQLPWDEDTAATMQEALAQLEEGEPLNGTFTRQAVAPEAGELEPTARADQPDGSATNVEGPRFEFRRAPPPTLPPKPLAGA